MGITSLTIAELGPKGDGIHHSSRGRVYVDRTAPGDRVTARVHKDEKGISRGELVKILSPSPNRQKAPCIHYEDCGSCTLQHLVPKYYRQWKIEMVMTAFQKQGLSPQRWLEPVFLDGQNRRRVTFTALKQRGKIVMGYYRRRSDQITDIETCLIADPKILLLKDAIKPHLSRMLTDGKSVDIFLQVVGDAVDMVITGPVGRKGKPDAPVREAISTLANNEGVTRISWRAFEHKALVPLASHGPVTATFGSLTVHLPPAAFLQPTPEGAQTLVNAILTAMPRGLSYYGKFADLFSGCGAFSGEMLRLGAVDSYESVPRMVHALTRAAQTESLRVFCRDLFRNPLRREEINRYDAVVFDPPRSGCPEQASAMASSRTKTLVGVSCNPATFARDARILCNGGYRLKSLQMIDQFLWSHHVEMVGVFIKQKRGS